MDHTHTDDRVTAYCPACVATVRAAEAEARWETAPLRRCTVDAHYGDPTNRSHLRFDVEVAVPADATERELDDQHAAIIGDAFVMALPDDVPLNETERAMTTMDVDRITVGPRVATPEPADPYAGMTPLFEETT